VRYSGIQLDTALDTARYVYEYSGIQRGTVDLLQNGVDIGRYRDASGISRIRCEIQAGDTGEIQAQDIPKYTTAEGYLYILHGHSVFIYILIRPQSHITGASRLLPRRARRHPFFHRETPSFCVPAPLLLLLAQPAPVLLQLLFCYDYNYEAGGTAGLGHPSIRAHMCAGRGRARGARASHASWIPPYIYIIYIYNNNSIYIIISKPHV